MFAEHVGIEHHPGLERFGLAVSGNRLPVQRDADSVQSLGGCIATSRGRIDRAAADPADAAAVMSELLVGEGLVAEQDGVAGLDEADRTAGQQQFRLQPAVTGQHVHQRLASLHGLSGFEHMGGDDPGHRRGHRERAAGLGFHQFLFEHGKVALERPLGCLPLAGQFLQCLLELGDEPAGGDRLALEDLHLADLVQGVGLLLLILQFTDVLPLPQAVELLQGLVGQPHLLVAGGDLRLELHQFAPGIGQLSRQPLGLCIEQLLLCGLHRFNAQRPLLQARAQRGLGIAADDGGTRHGDHGKGLARLHPPAFGDIDAGDHAGGRCQDRRHALDGYQLARDRRTAGVGAEDQEQHDRERGRRGEGGEDPQPDRLRQRDAAQPAGAPGLQRFPAKQRPRHSLRPVPQGTGTVACLQTADRHPPAQSIPAMPVRDKRSTPARATALLADRSEQLRLERDSVVLPAVPDRSLTMFLSGKYYCPLHPGTGLVRCPGDGFHKKGVILSEAFSPREGGGKDPLSSRCLASFGMATCCSLFRAFAGPAPGTGQGMKLSERILFARRRAGLTQAALARALCVQRSAVSNWESVGTGRPTMTNLIAIAKATDVSLEWLATGRGRVAVADDGARDEEVPAVDAELVEDSGERDLLASFRTLSPRQQLMALDLLKELAKGRRRA